MPRSFLKDCLAKCRNVNGKLFAQPFHGLLPSSTTVKKFCPCSFPPSGVNVSHLLLFFRFLLFLWCIAILLLCVQMRIPFYLSSLGYIQFLSVDPYLWSVLKTILARVLLPILLLVRSPPSGHWLDFVGLAFPSSMSLVHLLVSLCGGLHHFLSFLFQCFSFFISFIKILIVLWPVSGSEYLLTLNLKTHTHTRPCIQIDDAFFQRGFTFAILGKHRLHTRLEPFSSPLNLGILGSALRTHPQLPVTFPAKATLPFE